MKDLKKLLLISGITAIAALPACTPKEQDILPQDKYKTEYKVHYDSVYDAEWDWAENGGLEYLRKEAGFGQKQQEMYQEALRISKEKKISMIDAHKQVAHKYLDYFPGLTPDFIPKDFNVDYDFYDGLDYICPEGCKPTAPFENQRLGLYSGLGISDENGTPLSHDAIIAIYKLNCGAYKYLAGDESAIKSYYPYGLNIIYRKTAKTDKPIGLTNAEKNELERLKKLNAYQLNLHSETARIAKEKTDLYFSQKTR